MEKQELISYLYSLDGIVYHNGNDIDTIHLGHILAQYIENELGSRAYQEFNILLNDTLTVEACVDLEKAVQNGALNSFNNLYKLIKNEYVESIIILEFPSLIELVLLDLNKLVNKKEVYLNSYIENLIKEVVTSDKTLSNSIDIDQSIIFVQNKVKNIINLRAKTAIELNQLDLYKANKEVLLSQITTTLIEYCAIKQ